MAARVALVPSIGTDLHTTPSAGGHKGPLPYLSPRQGPLHRPRPYGC